jgi:catechol 2,3-dioxygenase-like lactoylglutathione lyase family enzyme
MRTIATVGVALAASTVYLMAAPAGEVMTAGNFIHVMGNVDKTIAFYHDVLGLETTGRPGPHEFADNAFVAKLYGTPGAQSRVTGFKLPDPSVALEFVEFKDIDQKTIQPRPQDPGASVLVLTVRSLDAALAKAREAGVPIVTAGGAPLMHSDEGGKSNTVVLKDPDGFYVELVERDPAPESQATGNVIAASLMVSVADTDKTLHLYRDLIGFQLKTDAAFAKDAMLSKALGVKGGEVRHSIGTLPGSNFQYDFVEWKGIDRKPAQVRIFDRGAGVLRVRVRDVDPFVANLKEAGVTVASAGDGPVEMNPANHFCILKDPNSFFFQIAPGPRPRPAQ